MGRQHWKYGLTGGTEHRDAGADAGRQGLIVRW